MLPLRGHCGSRLSARSYCELETMTPRFENLLYDVAGGIATITFNRPDKMNALSAPMMMEIGAAIDQTDADDAVRVVIITGAGERAFCAGADLSQGTGAFDYASQKAVRDRLKVNGVFRDWAAGWRCACSTVSSPSSPR
jgi:enoyl-CoA hydratase/carnithine racemase